MSTSKNIDRICIAVVALMLVITVLFMNGGALGISVMASSMPYESTLFDTSYVHEIDIVMDDWDTFIENCESEEYSSCTVVVDGSKYSNIAIRAKGNTSLSTVSSLGSDRYSFKLEFDHYESGKSLDGLDKLCLNNLIQDNTMMKDYIVYRLMDDFGVDAPLCSFAYVTVNGEDWGLYLAVEGIEDSFLERNYGSETGELYKPDSISAGGGRGNGQNFSMDDFDFGDTSETDTDAGTAESGTAVQSQTVPSMPGQMTGDGTNTSFPGQQGGQMTMPGQQGGDQTGFQDGQMPGQGDSQSGTSGESGDSMQSAGDAPQGDFSFGDGQFDMDVSNVFSGMGSDDVKLQYIDDDPDSYSDIFDSAKTEITEADEERLIQSLKNLNEYTDLENTVDIEEVIRYFVIHNFVCNGDSYTGSMIHNYYLYEEDGILSMIPWDYNLAFGTFQGNDASGTVNTSIDSPVSGGSVDDRPMLGWIFSDETYTEEYHQLFSEFIEKWFTDGELAQMINDTADMIRSYVEKDPTKFCTTEEFEAGVTALKEFVTLRAEAVSNQLAGNDTVVDTGSLNLSDMGTMNNNGGGGMDMPDNMFDGSMGLSSFITLTDSEGNKVDISTVIPDTASVSSVTLSDGSEVSLSLSDMQSLGQLDVAEIVSVTDSEGNVYDLSAYTIAVSVPSASGGNGGGMTMPSMPGQDGNSTQNQPGQDGTAPTEPASDSGAADTAEVPGTPDAANALDSQSGTFPTQPDGSNQMSMPGGNEQMSMSDGDSQMTMPNGDGQMSMPDGFAGGTADTATASDTVNWILTGVSVLVLALGIIVAAKKKY